MGQPSTLTNNPLVTEGLRTSSNVYMVFSFVLLVSCHNIKVSDFLSEPTPEPDVQGMFKTSLL